MGRNLEEMVAPCLRVENSHSFLKESTLCSLFMHLFTQLKRSRTLLTNYRDLDPRSHCSQGDDSGFSVLNYLLANEPFSIHY